MLINNNALTLINPQNGNLAFKVFNFNDNSHFDHIQRNNYYTLIWVTQGEGTLKVDFTEYAFLPGTLLSFAPYQPFMLLSTQPLEGVAIHFHPDFFCIHKHHNEVACNGVLFNNIYRPPFCTVDPLSASTFNMTIEHMKTEMQNPAMAQYELLISYLKIFLITGARLKAAQQPESQRATANHPEPFILQKLKDVIEAHYKTKHSAGSYASLLNITPKALAKLTKTHLNKTLTNLIAERIIIEAKRELYLTNKSVKEIAYELGFNDEFYFSRFFKSSADVSPQLYRETVGFSRREVLTP